MYICVCGHTILVFFISKFLGLLGHMLNVCLTLQATNKLISKVSCPTSDK